MTEGSLSGNGSYVSRAELTAHLGPMKDDIAEMKGDLKTLLAQESAGWLGARGQKIADQIMAGGLAAVVAAGVTLLIR